MCVCVCVFRAGNDFRAGAMIPFYVHGSLVPGLAQPSLAAGGAWYKQYQHRAMEHSSIGVGSILRVLYCVFTAHRSTWRAHYSGCTHKLHIINQQF